MSFPKIYVIFICRKNKWEFGISTYNHGFAFPCLAALTLKTTHLAPRTSTSFPPTLRHTRAFYTKCRHNQCLFERTFFTQSAISRREIISISRNSLFYMATSNSNRFSPKPWVAGSSPPAPANNRSRKASVFFFSVFFCTKAVFYLLFQPFSQSTRKHNRTI